MENEKAAAYDYDEADSSIDLREIAELLIVAEKLGLYPSLNNIAAKVNNRLREINEEMAPEPIEAAHIPVPPDEDQGTTVEPRKEEPKSEPTKPEHLTAKENQWPETFSANSDPAVVNPNGAPRRTVVAATPKT